MASNLRGAQFLGEIGELTGYKTGLALDEDRFCEIFVAGGYEEFWPPDPDAWLRIRSEMLEEIFAFTLARLGVGPDVHVINPLGFVYHRVKGDQEKWQSSTSLGRCSSSCCNRLWPSRRRRKSTRCRSSGRPRGGSALPASRSR